MIFIDNINFSYGMLTVFDQTTFSACKGELTVIKGESGSGKTTLLELLSLRYGLSFDLYYNHQKIDKDNMYHNYLDNLYYINQDPLFCNDLTILQQCQLLTDLYSCQIDITSYTKLLGLEDVMNHYPLQLSGDEKLRVSLLYALIIKPHILLIDEPTSSLNQEYSSIYLKIIDELKQECIVIVTSHDDDIINHADCLYNINHYQLNVIVKNYTENHISISNYRKKNHINWFNYYYQMMKHKSLRSILRYCVLSIIISLCTFSLTMDNAFIKKHTEALSHINNNSLLVYKALDSRYPGYEYKCDWGTYFPISHDEYEMIENIDIIKNIQPKIILFSDDARNETGMTTMKIIRSDEVIFDYTTTATKLMENNTLYTIYAESILENERDQYIIDEYSNDINGVYINYALLKQCNLDNIPLKNCMLEIKLCIPIYDVSGLMTKYISDPDLKEDTATSDDFIPANYLETKTITLIVPINGIIQTDDNGHLLSQKENSIYFMKDYLYELIQSYSVQNTITKYYQYQEDSLVEIESIENAELTNVYTPWRPNAYVIETDNLTDSKKVFNLLQEYGFTVDWEYQYSENYGNTIINMKRMLEVASISLLLLVVIALTIAHYVKGKNEMDFNQWLKNIGFHKKNELFYIKIKKYIFNEVIIVILSLLSLFIINKSMLYILHNNYFISFSSLLIILCISIFTEFIVPLIWEVTHYVKN